MFVPSAFSIGRYGPVVRGCPSRTSNPARSRERPRDLARETPLVGDFAERVRPVHELAERRTIPKNSRIAARTACVHPKVVRMALTISWYTLIFSLMARSMADQPMRLICDSSPHRWTGVCEIVDVVDDADCFFPQLEEIT